MKQKMQGKHLFEYAVIRVVPRVEREEFINVGVILFCSKLKFLKTQITVNDQRLSAFSGTLDLEEIRTNLHAFAEVSNGVFVGSTIAHLDQASRFRWLTAMRSTVIQTSRIHPGFCEDPNEKLQRLHDQLVL
jgi:hypothetical protein